MTGQLPCSRSGNERRNTDLARRSSLGVPLVVLGAVLRGIRVGAPFFLTSIGRAGQPCPTCERAERETRRVARMSSALMSGSSSLSSADLFCSSMCARSVVELVSIKLNDQPSSTANEREVSSGDV